MPRPPTSTIILAAVAMMSGGRPPAPPQQGAIVGSGFIYETAPFPSAHASTIAETKSGLVAAWFGGKNEGAPDVAIWTSRRVSGQWSAPVEAANGAQPGGTRFPCWNPVLFQHRGGALDLFYKVGPSPREWWGMVRTSADDGRTWSAPRRLPTGFLGPIKNKPIELGGVIIAPSSTESMDTPPHWRVHFERSVDGGKTWSRVLPTYEHDRVELNAIQPSILVYPGGRLQAVGRTQSDFVFESWSSDTGKTWTALDPTTLPNPNAGIDAVTLRDGRQLIVYNHTPQGRTPLNVAVSRDGKLWEAALVLESEPGEYSYPAVIQASDGMVHVTYTWKRQRIKHVVIDPAKLTSTPMPGGKWPIRP